ncbi:FAD binding domain-containing protein [Amorphus orientalis]|uniref:Carbon-monoxide dehydrogenase medium subunit n=1 Tax=Amorphus orientalis TaxID=649198 RepID=A0AAE4AS03_9HYPH|nr:FAD binding domain-containing protein [Amorphus orientalis]MDQ0314460.1 carbon-monoxide dehydrogenase medium subunit [Amorphus orientalis]
MEVYASGSISVTQSDLPPVALFRPASVDDAIADLAEAPAPAAIFAGGTDFFAWLREGATPASLIWIDRIEEMKAVEQTADALVLGARLTHDEAWQHPALDAVPGLAASWRKIATVRIRRQATLGGNLMARRTRYELSILLTALGASARFAGPAGVTELPVDKIWDADLSAHPLLVSVSIPLAGAPAIDYERSLRPTVTQALCRRGSGVDATHRVVVATEFLRPWWTDAAAADAPETVFAKLPDDFHDPAVGRSYVAKAGAAFLRRQIARLGDPA